MSHYHDDIVFFDGLCVLCSGTVATLIRIDKRRVLRYSSLQGQYAKDVLNIQHVETNESVIFLSQGVAYQKAEAIIRILLRVGGFYRFLGLLLKMFPKFVLDRSYHFIARNRYQFFGKNKSCLLPLETDKNLFIP